MTIIKSTVANASSYINAGSSVSSTPCDIQCRCTRQMVTLYNARIICL